MNKNSAIEFCKEKRTSVVSFITSEREISFDDYFKENEYFPKSRDKVSVKFVCTKCKKNTGILTIGSFYKKNTKLVCKDKSCKGKTGPKCITFENFMELLGNRYVLIISEQECIKLLSGNNPSKINIPVKCNNPACNTKFKVTYTRLKNNNKCPSCSHRKYTYEDVVKIFSDRKCTLLSTEYKNNHDYLNYKCKCGNITWVELTNFLRYKSPCGNCMRDNNKLWAFFGENMDERWNSLQDYFEDCNCRLLSEKEFYVNDRETILEYVCECFEIGQTTLKSFLDGVRCESCRDDRRKETCMEKYGVDNPAKSEICKEKQRETSRENWGTDHPMQNEHNKQQAKQTNIENHEGLHNLALTETRLKAVEAHIKKYGGPPGTIESIREKAKQTNMQKLGVEFPLQSKQVQITIQNNNLEKYGNKVYIQSEAGKAQMVELYGVENAMQNPELFAKQQKSSKKTRPYIFPSGRETSIQGYEHFALNDLLEMGVDENDIIAGGKEKLLMPEIWYYNSERGRKSRYHPDIFLPKENKFIEVKCYYTWIKEKKKNTEKFMECMNRGYKLVLWVYDKYGQHEMIRMYFNNCIHEIVIDNEERESIK